VLRSGLHACTDMFPQSRPLASRPALLVSSPEAQTNPPTPPHHPAIMRPPANFVGPRGLALSLLLACMVGAAQRRRDSGLGGKPQPPPPVLPVTFNTTFSSFAVLQSAPAKSAVYGMTGAVALGVCVVRTAWLLFTVAAAPLVVCSDPSSPSPPKGVASSAGPRIFWPLLRSLHFSLSAAHPLICCDTIFTSFLDMQWTGTPKNGSSIVEQKISIMLAMVVSASKTQRLQPSVQVAAAVKADGTWIAYFPPQNAGGNWSITATCDVSNPTPILLAAPYFFHSHHT